MAKFTLLRNFALFHSHLWSVSQNDRFLRQHPSLTKQHVRTHCGVWGVDCASLQRYKVCVVTAPHGSALNDIPVKEGKKVRTIYVGVIAAITGYLWVTGIAMAQETTQAEVTLLVYRRLDNRAEGLADDSPRALDLHNQRKPLTLTRIDPLVLTKMDPLLVYHNGFYAR